MPQTELKLKQYLDNIGVKYYCQTSIDVPFAQSRKHKVDFYLPEYKLYIEVKGQMTIYAVATLLWEHIGSGENFYVYQATNENWMTPYDKSQHQTLKSKLEQNLSKQQEELKNLVDGKITAEVLSKRSLSRLIGYIGDEFKGLADWLSVSGESCQIG